MASNVAWYVRDKISGKYFTLTKYSKCIYLDTNTMEVLVLCECESLKDAPDYIFEDIRFKCVARVPIYQFGQIYRLFERHTVKF